MSEASAKVELQLTTRNQVAVLAIKGRLDAVRVGSVREEIGGLPEKGHAKVVLDLTDLEWIDSSGVGALVVLYKNARAKGGEVKVANLQRQPKEIFRLLRLETAFEIFDTVDAAVAKLGG
jgi:anti-sigma B factor antagonist